MKNLKQPRQITNLLSVVFALLWTVNGNGQINAPINQVLVQPPELGRPERGSVVGSLSKLTFGPADVLRGVFTLPAVFDVPMQRGDLLVNVFPAYTPESGISEWGLGWQAELAITRHRLVGDLDYQTDGYTSPWGRLRPGQDGYWYVTGLKRQIRLSQQGDDWLAIFPDGTRYLFGEQVDTPLGTYSWYLSRVTTLLDDQTELVYERNTTGRPFLVQVYYGGRGNGRDYLLEFDYLPLEQGFTSYRSGTKVELDRRVSQVKVKSWNHDTQSYEMRWYYDVQYRQSLWSPVFFLKGVTKVYASGENEPTVLYAYDHGVEQLVQAEIEHLEELDEYLAVYGSGGLHPNRVGLVDLDQDGRIDLEYPRKALVLRQTDQGWQEEKWPEAENTDTRCRPPAWRWSGPRKLVRLLPDSEKPQVYWAVYISSRTTVAVCNWLGQLLFEDKIPGIWQIDENRRLADVNRDRRSDVFKVWRGHYQVLENISSADEVAFKLHDRRKLSPVVEPSKTWLRDMNGDGLVDIVSRVGAVLVIWSGKGNFEFSEGQKYWFYNSRNRRMYDLENFGISLLDANKDGLTDVLVNNNQRAFLFMRSHERFVGVDIPILNDLRGYTPIVADLSGRGNVELVYIPNNRQAKAIMLTRASTGLMVEANDGKGTVLTFEYGRGPAWPGAGKRPAVLKKMHVKSVGYDSVSYEYSYAKPVLHSKGKFLVGYETTAKKWPFLKETVRFLNNDHIAGLVLSSRNTDQRTPEIAQIERHEYQEQYYQGVAWQRPLKTFLGWQNLVTNQEYLQQSELTSYSKEICPTEVTTSNQHGLLTESRKVMQLPALSNAMHCLFQAVEYQGKHADSLLDFKLAYQLERNPQGQVTVVSQVGDTQENSLILQEVSYDQDYRIKSILRPGYGHTQIDYDLVTGLLQKVTAPTGVITQSRQRNPISDALKELAVERGLDNVLTAWFEYDGQERLSKSWQDFGGSSASNPLEQFDYHFPTLEKPGLVLSHNLVDAIQGSQREKVILSAADGETIAQGTRIPVGWALSDLVFRSRQERQVTSFWQKPLTDTEDLLTLEYSKLFDGAIKQSSTKSAGFGHIVGQDTLIQTSQEQGEIKQEIITTLTLGQQALVSSRTENQTYSTKTGQDLAGRVLWVEDQNQARTSMTYDALGRLVQVSLADGTQQKVRFDAYGRLSQLLRDDVGLINYHYEADTGRLKQKTFASLDGQIVRQVEYVLDSIGRVTKEIHQDKDSKQEIFLEYDGQGQLGHLTKVKNGLYERQMDYNPDGSLKKRVITLGEWKEISYAFEYYADGSVAWAHRVVRDLVTDSIQEENEQEYIYDNWGRLTAIRRDNQEFIDLSYDAEEGKLTKARFSSGEEILFSYDQKTKELSGYRQVSPDWQAGVDWLLDKRGHIISERFLLGDQTLERDYQYDARGFLERAIDATQTSTYSYTATGLLTEVNDLKGDREKYTVDPIGRIIQRGDLELEYGPTGQLKKARRGAQAWEFCYNEAGQRVLKSAQGRPVAGYVDGAYISDTNVVEAVKVGNLVVGLIDSDNQFQLLAMDNRGTLLAEDNDLTMLPTPYGVRKVRPRRSPVIDYVEHGYDVDLKTVRLGVRDYDPDLGRFLTPDPLFLEDIERCARSPVECSLYSYAGNNPVTFVDPTGKSIWSKLAKVGVKVVKGGSVADAFVDNAKDAATFVNPAASPCERIIAGASLLSELFPISISDVKDLGRLAKRIPGFDKVAGIVEGHVDRLTKATKVGSVTDDTLRRLSPEMRKSVRSWQNRLTEHHAKLDAYRKNPAAFDNKGFLKNAPTPEIRQRIIDRRIHHLETEIRNFERQIADALSGG